MFTPLTLTEEENTTPELLDSHELITLWFGNQVVCKPCIHVFHIINVIF